VSSTGQAPPVGCCGRLLFKPPHFEKYPRTSSAISSTEATSWPARLWQPRPSSAVPGGQLLANVDEINLISSG